MGLFDSVTNFITGGKSGDATASQHAALTTLQNAPVGTVSDLFINLQRVVQEGIITPEQAQSVVLGKSQLGEIVVPPELMTAQNKVLTELGNIASQGGMTAIDKNRLEDIRKQQEQVARGAREAEAQSAAQRGVSGGGLEQLRRMTANQSAAETASAQGTQVAAEAQKRALEALQSQGTMATGMRTQAFGEEQAKAAAADAIAKFNAANQQTTNMANVQARNVAQATNVSETQRIAELNAAKQAEEQKAAADAYKTKEQQALDKAKAESAAQSNLATQQTAQGASNRGMLGSVIEAAPAIFKGVQSMGGLSGIGSAIGSFFSDEKLKDHVKELTSKDIDEMLGKLTGYKYQYKNDPMNKEHNGVMAQDMEKAGLGNVIDTPAGKMGSYDQNDLHSMTAALANIHNRVKKMEKSK